MQGKGLIALVLAAVVAGCLSREETVKRLRTDNPRVQAATVARVVRDGDASMTGELIDLLESEDEGVRFMAATGLHKLTGTDRGFHFAKPEERQKIVVEWRRWWQAASGGSAGRQANDEDGPTGKGHGDASEETGKESSS